MATQNMGLSVPTVLGTPGPAYASQLNTDLIILDAHNHTQGAGAPIPTAALNINADLPVGGNNVQNVRSTRYASQSAALGLGADVSSTYVVNGDLYYNNATGYPVRLTNGNSLNYSASGGISGDYVPAGATVVYTDATKTYAFWSPGQINYANLQSNEIVVTGTTPGVQFYDTTAGEKSFRVGANANEWHLSCDTTGTRARTTAGHYSTAPNVLVATSTGNVGIGGSPSSYNFAVYGQSSNFCLLQSYTDRSQLLLQGVPVAAGNRSAMLSLYDSTYEVDIGLLSNAGATALGGAAGDLVLKFGASEAVRFAKNTGYLGLQCVPRNPLDVYGSAAFGNLAGGQMPPNTLAVGGQLYCGTAVPPIGGNTSIAACIGGPALIGSGSLSAYTVTTGVAAIIQGGSLLVNQYVANAGGKLEVGGLAVANSFQTSGTVQSPSYLLRDSSRAVNASGLTRTWMNNGAWQFDTNTATAGDFSTYSSPMLFDLVNNATYLQQASVVATGTMYAQNFAPQTAGTSSLGSGWSSLGVISVSFYNTAGATLGKVGSAGGLRFGGNEWLQLPQLSTTTRNAVNGSVPVNGAVCYNTTTNKFNFYENGAWVNRDGTAA